MRRKILGVISDTHLKAPDESLRRTVAEVFENAEMILHAGDLTQLSVLDVFRPKKVVAVCGNMDGNAIKIRLPETQIVEYSGARIGLIHGWGSPRGLENRIIGKFSDVDAIVYGHTHKAANHRVNGLLMFNPGSFSGSFLLHRGRSVGILHIDEEIRGEIVPL